MCMRIERKPHHCRDVDQNLILRLFSNLNKKLSTRKPIKNSIYVNYICYIYTMHNFYMRGRKKNAYIPTPLFTIYNLS